MNRLLSLLLILLVLFSCARQTTPDGGPKDVTPPTLIRSHPENNEKQFTDKTLTFLFSEPIKLNNPKEEIIITPETKNLNFLVKQNKLTITAKQDWQDSTTYSIAFRDGIQDITENNPVDNLRIAFSTGRTIDSLSFRGKVISALTEKIPEKITVAIYQSDTFHILAHAPSYFTRTNKRGSFLLTNLKEGSYRIYALEDKNKNLKLEPSSEPYGFLSGRVTLPMTEDSLRISIIRMDSRTPKLNTLRHANKLSTAKLNKPIVAYTIKSTTHVLNAFGDDQSEINFYHNLSLNDSIQISLSGTDSLNQNIDTSFYIKSSKNTPLEQNFKPDIKSTQFNPETNTFQSLIYLNKPLAQITLDSIYFRVDSITLIPFSHADFTYDTAYNKLLISKKINTKLFKEELKSILFKMGKGTLLTISHDSSASLTRTITLPKTEDFAMLLLDVKTDATDFEIQLLTTEYIVFKSARNAKHITFTNIPAGDYRIRSYIDLNHNRQWDPGNINKDIAPEPTFFYRTPQGRYQFPLRANWQVGPYLITF